MHELMDLLDIARLEEARLAKGIGEIADEARPFAGGIMARAAPGSWINGVFGAGLETPVTSEQVREMVQFFESHGIVPRIELSPFVHKSLVEQLGAAGFVFHVFDNVFFRPLDRAERVTPPQPTPPGLVIRPVIPSNAADIERYARASLGPNVPDVPAIVEGMLETTRRVARHPRCIALVAEMDSRIVSTGALELDGDIATLFALSVVKDYRRRGIQQAMMAWRLNRAIESGAKVATISAHPRVGTERNARRMSFQVAYTKAVLVKRGERLTGVVE